MSTIRINCPFCKAPVEISSTDHPDVQCRNCGKVFRAPPVAMNVEYGWYFIDRKKPVGPVSREKLQERTNNGLLKPGDMLRQEGNQKWQVAETVPGLFVSQAGTASVSNSPGKNKRRWAIGAAAVLFIALAFLRDR